ncbi:MAG: cytochrome b/b6 domain-containing protein [Deltaproteobacteria bacterium]|nr:cytochrome b/b6 domain-containing protein [Deltaproteobacteria bacterium]
MKEVQVWDSLVRIIHWGLALSILGAVSTAEFDSLMVIHVWFGSVAVLLVVTRLMWGFFGPPQARFSSFLKSPRVVLDYLRDMAQHKAPRTLGHNPAAGWVMTAMLGLVILITVSGLPALAGQEHQMGPLVGRIGFRLAKMFEEVHEVLSGFLAVLVAMHLVGIVVHGVLHRENIVRSMINGRKQAEPGDPAGDMPPAKGMAFRVVLSVIPAVLLAAWLL